MQDFPPAFLGHKPKQTVKKNKFVPTAHTVSSTSIHIKAMAQVRGLRAGIGTWLRYHSRCPLCLRAPVAKARFCTRMQHPVNTNPWRQHGSLQQDPHHPHGRAGPGTQLPAGRYLWGGPVDRSAPSLTLTLCFSINKYHLKEIQM